MKNLCKLHEDVVFGRSGGKIIWQPRISCWYKDRVFAGQPLPAPYTGMKIPEIFRALGVSDRLYGWYGQCFPKHEHPAVRFIEEPVNETDFKVTIETPVGKQVAINRRTSSSAREIRLKWEVETEEELKVAAWRAENTTWEYLPERFEASLRDSGDLGAPTMIIPRMNVQSLYLEKMGIERGILAIHDWPDTVEAYFRALEECHDRLLDLVCASPIKILNFGENVHAGTLSPSIFMKYHLPACQRRCEKLHAAGKFISAHWDGDCGPLLKYAKETGLDAIEAITPKPQGDVTLEQIKEGLGDEMFLLDGIPAVYFDETFPVQTLIDCTHRLIELFAPKLVLGISDEISSTGDIERIRVVDEIVDRYNAQFEC